jgi:CxxC motif-containing protein (DUF1111 family)
MSSSGAEAKRFPLDRSRRLDFEIGRALFERLWVSAPSSTQAADGLGLLFNARACRSCHLNDGRGAPPASRPGSEEDSLSLVAHLSRVDEMGQSGPKPTYGYQLQPLALHGHRGEGRLRVAYREETVTLADGEAVALRRPSYRIEGLGYGELDPEARLSPRLPPQLIGLGLLEAILRHGGEAQGARDRVGALLKQERRALLRFVESL